MGACNYDYSRHPEDILELGNVKDKKIERQKLDDSYTIKPEERIIKNAMTYDIFSSIYKNKKLIEEKSNEHEKKILKIDKNEKKETSEKKNKLKKIPKCSTKTSAKNIDLQPKNSVFLHERYCSVENLEQKKTKVIRKKSSHDSSNNTYIKTNPNSSSKKKVRTKISNNHLNKNFTLSLSGIDKFNEKVQTDRQDKFLKRIKTRKETKTEIFDEKQITNKKDKFISQKISRKNSKIIKSNEEPKTDRQEKLIIKKISIKNPEKTNLNEESKTDRQKTSVIRKITRQNSKTEKLDENSKTDRQEKFISQKISRKNSKTIKLEKIDRNEKNDRIEKNDKIDKIQITEKCDKIEKNDKIEKTEKKGKIDKIEKVEKNDKFENIENIEKKYNIEKNDKIEKIGSNDKIDKIKTTEKKDKIDNIERIKQNYKIDKIDEILTPEKNDETDDFEIIDEIITTEKNDKNDSVERIEKNDKIDENDKIEKNDKIDNIEKNVSTDKNYKNEKNNKTDKIKKIDINDKINNTERTSKDDKIDKYIKTSKNDKISNTERTEKNDKIDKIDINDKIDKTEKTEKIIKTNKNDKNNKTDEIDKIIKNEKNDKIDKIVTNDKIDKTERTEKNIKIDKNDKIEKDEKNEKIITKKTEKSSKNNKNDKITKIDKNEKNDNIERTDKNEKNSKIDKIEKNDNNEKTEKNEKNSKNEKNEKNEKISKTDRNEKNDNTLKIEQTPKINTERTEKTSKLNIEIPVKNSKINIERTEKNSKFNTETSVKNSKFNTERTEKNSKINTEKTEKNSKINTERTDTNEKNDNNEKTERNDKSSKTDKIMRVEKITKVDKNERNEKRPTNERNKKIEKTNRITNNSKIIRNERKNNSNFNENYILPIIVIKSQHYKEILNYLNPQKFHSTQTDIHKKLNILEKISQFPKSLKTVKDPLIKTIRPNSVKTREPIKERIKTERIKIERKSNVRQNNFSNNSKREKKNQNDSNDERKKEQMEYIKKYKDVSLILEKLLIRDNDIKNFEKPRNSTGDFIACAADALKFYTMDEINNLIERLKNFEIFQKNFDKKIYEWGKRTLLIIEGYVEVKLHRKIENYSGGKYQTVLIGGQLDDEILPERLKDINFIKKKNYWNIIYHTYEQKEFKEIYEEVDYIEEEVSCNFFITNSKKYLSMLVGLIKKQNMEKVEIKAKFSLVMKKTMAKSTLEFLEAKNYFKYFNKIIIIIRKGEDKEKLKKEKLAKFQKYIDGIFDDKNEIILFFKKNNPKSVPIQINKVLSFAQYNAKYITLHEKISKFYQNKAKKNNKAKKRVSKVKAEIEDYLSKLFIKMSSDNVNKNYSQSESLSSSIIQNKDSDIIEEKPLCKLKTIPKAVKIEKKDEKKMDKSLEFFVNQYNKRKSIMSIEKVIGQLYKFSLKEEYDSAIDSFTKFLNSEEINLKMKLSEETKKKYGFYEKNSNEKQIKSKVLLDLVKTTFGSYNKISEIERFNIFIKMYISEEDSFYQDFNIWLRELDEVNIGNISYFIADLMYIFNQSLHGLTGRHNLYRGLKMSFGDLLLYKQNEGHVIIFPSFTSTTKNKTESEKFSGINEDSDEEIKKRKEDKIFSVMMIIKYNCEKEYIPSCFDITEFSKDNFLFLPFSFFNITDVTIDEINYTGVIELISVNKKEILEKYMNEDIKVSYDDIEDTVQIKRVKNVLIHCTDNRELHILNNTCKFLEEVVDGNFLLTNNKEDFELVLEQIKHDNTNKSKAETLIKFDLILFESIALETINFLKTNKDLDYFNNIIVMSGNKEKYAKEIEEGIVSAVLINRVELIKFIREKSIGSLFPLRICDLITMSKYYRKYNLFHEIISENYQKLSKNLFETANEILSDYILSKNPNLTNEELLKCLSVFRKDNSSPLRRHKKIIRRYTAEDKSFYQDFNYWLRNPDPATIEKIGYFISDFIFSLNEYGRLVDAGLKGQHTLYRGLKMTFSDLLLYKMNVDSVISFLSPTSTSKNEEVAIKFSSMDILVNQYAVVMKINYNCPENQIPTVVDITNLSDFDEDERLILPFSFFKISNVIINKNEKKAIIEMETLNREKINESELTEKSIIKYNKEKGIMECTNNKIVIYNVENNKLKTKIFGEFFVKNNKDILKLKIEGKEINLCEDYFFKNLGENVIEIIENEKIKETKSMFEGCHSLNSIDTLKNWDISYVKNASNMFKNCDSLTSIFAVKKWNTGNLRNVSNMFYGCSSITSIDSLKNWNVSNVLNTSGMFEDCSSIISIDSLKHWNINVLNINIEMENPNLQIPEKRQRRYTSHMNRGSFFKYDIRKNTMNTKPINKNFSRKVSQIYTNTETNINIKNEEKEKESSNKIITNEIYTYKDNNNICFIINNMFCGCSSITSIKALKNWNMLNVENTASLFQGCSSINNIDVLEKWNMINVKNTKSMFENCSSITNIESLKEWNTNNLRNSSNMFKGCSNIKSIHALKNWNMSKVTNSSSMFENCILIKSIESLKNWNMKNVVDINSMFQNCCNINSIDALKDWNLNSIKFVDCLFSGCNNIISIDAVENWNMEKVQYTKKMFQNCNNITNIDALKNWNMKNVIYTSYMFQNCNNIINIDALKNWDMSNVQYASCMFDGCLKINSLDALENWNMSKVQYISKMFQNCCEINDLNGLKNWDTKNVEYASNLFTGCKNLNNIDGLSNWDVKKVKDMGNMFAGCRKICSLDGLKNWEINNVINTYCMFQDCIGIKSIDPLINWSLSDVENSNYMFQGCYSINLVEGLKKNMRLYDIAKHSVHSVFEDDNNDKDYQNIDYDKNKVKKITYYTNNLHWEWKINIFGNQFVEENKEKIILKIDGEMIPLCSKYILKNYGKNIIEIIEKEKIQSLSYMFCDCSSLTSIDDLKNWDLTNAVIKKVNQEIKGGLGNKTKYFYNSFTTTSFFYVLDVSHMFEGCSSITCIDALKNWSMGKVNNTSYMFSGCSSIILIDALKNWNMSNIKDASYMFQGCTSINSINALKNWKMNYYVKSNVFSGCIISQNEIDNILNIWNGNKK